VDLSWRGGRLVESGVVSHRGNNLQIRYRDTVREYHTRPGERIVFRPRVA
jgi:hypothetical protein